MPGTPPASPRFAVPRYSDGDTAAFASQVNAITDTFDAAAQKYAAGTHAARLAATNIDGLLWRETDTGQLFLGTGTTWLPIGFSYVAATVSTTAANGQWLVASAGVTITLPSAAANARVVVSAAAGVSGSSPVTVSGSSIQGVGLSSALSFKLGVPGAFAELISDGTNWFIVAGQQDTGWVALTLSTNIGVATGTYTPAARLVGDRVFLQGGFVNSTGSAITSGTQFATIPTGLRPASTVTYPIYASSFNASFIAFGTSGAIFYDGLNSWPNTFTTSVDGISYRIS